VADHVTRDELIERGDANLVAYLRHLACTAKGGGVSEDDGLLLFAGGHNYPGTYTNGAIRTNAGVAPAELIERATAFFAPRRRGYAVWVRDHADADLEEAVRAAGFWQRPPVEGNPGIAIDHPLPERPPLPGTEIRRVADEQGRRDYLRVIATGYEVGDVPDELAEAILFSLKSLDDPRVAVFVAYVDDKPVSGCMVFVECGSAGLQWGSTLPEARGTGLGKATFLAACNAGFDMGATCATGQSSAQGTPIWLRMGFEVVTHYRRYLAPPPRAGR
jgi:GNAT superfamily N-acetyltransferase